VVMVTHDVDEAVLLSDRIVMLTTPTADKAATIGKILEVNLPRPRDRVHLAGDPYYQKARKSVIDFLYAK
jgi:nitrate/nitrite transport system ATP-binding protein